ncbi:MAG: hypothetical protein KAS84_06755 [Anaerolineales bacterium]|nr:hypothetical protein [Anaerolineales bacterium]
MPKIQTTCPNCQQPIIAEIQQVIDVGENPQLKEVILTGALNFAQCQFCGFQGQIPVPIVYHDANKELLYTYNPPDINKSMEEKEASLAPLLKKIIDSLDPKDRKGYLFQPKAMLTINNLVKTILLEDGITEEMIQGQQEKMKLLDDLFIKEGEVLIKTIKDNNDRIDREFFAIFTEIAQRIIASQDEKAVAKVQLIQDALLTETDIGKEIFNETREIQAASQSLEALGKNLTRGALLELVISAPNNERVKALTSLARPAMDYDFFQMFTERIEKSDNGSRQKLVDKRNLMLKVTQEIDQRVQERLKEAKNRIEALVNQEPLEEAILHNIAQIDQFFIQALSTELELAIKENNTKRKEKLERLLHKIQDITKPAELKLLDQLLATTEDEVTLAETIEDMEDQISSQLIDYLTSIISNYEEQVKTSEEEERSELKESLDRLKIVYNAVLRKSMKMKFKG